MSDFMVEEPEKFAKVCKLLDTMYISARDPEVYVLHRMYNAVILAGGCIAGRILGAPKAQEYWLTAEKQLDVPLQLDWRTLTVGSQHERLVKAMKQLADAAQNPKLTYQIRSMHVEVLMGMAAIACAAGMPEASDYNRLAWEIKMMISTEESSNQQEL